MIPLGGAKKIKTAMSTLRQRLKKAKELLLYNEFTLTEISQQLGYKSVQHLSAQFKNSTGFNPTSFKKLKSKNRIALDQI